MQETLTWCQRQETTFGMVLTYNGLGTAALAAGDIAKATQIFKELLTLSIEIHDTGGVIWATEGLAGAALLQRMLPQAATLWGAAARLRTEFNFPLPPILNRLYSHSVQMAQSQLDKPTWLAAWTKGEAMSIADLATFAL